MPRAKKKETEAPAGAVTETVQRMPLSELHPFEGHPFKVLDDDSMTETVESIRQMGVANPLIVRPDPDGGYEIISGHRRRHAAELAGLDTIPVIVRELDDDAAVIMMVDSNLQRENILPSERAKAYKMKLEALKHQGQRHDLTSTQVVEKLAAEQVGDDAGMTSGTRPCAAMCAGGPRASPWWTTRAAARSCAMCSMCRTPGRGRTPARSTSGPCVRNMSPLCRMCWNGPTAWGPARGWRSRSGASPPASPLNIPIGSYRGFQMELSYNTFEKQFQITMKGEMSHHVSLGTDARGNLTRLDNALAGIPGRLERGREQLENLRNQQSAAQVELTKPFPQEAELAEKSARLAELDAALSMEDSIDRDGGEVSEEVGDGERPSVLEDLKKRAAEIPPDKKPGKEPERG